MEINIGNCCVVIVCGAWQLFSWMSVVELGWLLSHAHMHDHIHDFGDLDHNTTLELASTCIKMLICAYRF